MWRLAPTSKALVKDEHSTVVDSSAKEAAPKALFTFMSTCCNQARPTCTSTTSRLWSKKDSNGNVVDSYIQWFHRRAYGQRCWWEQIPHQGQADKLFYFTHRVWQARWRLQPEAEAMILLTHMVHDFHQLMDCIGAANSSCTSSHYPYADFRGGHGVCLPTENIGIVVLLQSGRTSPWYQVC